MKRFLLSTFLGATAVYGQMAPQPQANISQGALDTWNLDWDGLSNRTYFLQYSEDLENWHYFPAIESGASLPLSYGFSSTAEKFFVRLKYTDQETEDAAADDFDGDGLSNISELTTSNTDPLNTDSDGDGMLDGWEIEHNLDPTDNGSTAPANGPYGDSDGDGTNNGDEYAAGTNPNSNLEFPDQLISMIRSWGYAHTTTAPEESRNRFSGNEYWFHNNYVDDFFDGAELSIAALRSRADTTWLYPEEPQGSVITTSNSNAYAGSSYGNYLANNTNSITQQEKRFFLKTASASTENRYFDFMVLSAGSWGQYTGTTTTTGEIWNEDYISVTIPAGETISEPVDTKAFYDPNLNIPDANCTQGCSAQIYKLGVTIRHTEKIRDQNGKETEKIIELPLNHVYRDEIVDLIVTFPAKPNEDRVLKIDVATEAMRKETLGARGLVQMYDFGKVNEDGSVTPLTTHASGPDAGQTKDGPYEFSVPAGATQVTLKGVFNKEGKIKLSIEPQNNTNNEPTLISQEITVEKRVRKYGIPYPGFPNHDPNKYDEQFFDAAKFWGEFYQYEIDTVDRLKAMAVAESSVGANPTLSSQPNDILTIGHPDDPGLASIRGETAQWDRDMVDPRKPAADARYKKLNYPQASVTKSREAIKWAVLWLYVRGFSKPADIQENPNYTYEKRNKSPYEILTAEEEPEFTQKPWVDWPEITRRYNGNGVYNATNGRETYEDRVNPALYKGEHWNAASGNKSIWPILTNKKPRKSDS